MKRSPQKPYGFDEFFNKLIKRTEHKTDRYTEYSLYIVIMFSRLFVRITITYIDLLLRCVCLIDQIVEYIGHNGVMKDLSVLQEPPFTDKGSIVEVFTDLSVWLGIRRIIEQINSNAAA